jgi:hypothetical protein
VSLQEFLKAFGSLYEFSGLPQVFKEDYDPQKGVEFRGGKLGDVNIERVLVFPRAVAVDTRSSTDDSDYVMEEALKWVQTFVGLSSPIQITRKTYWSQMSFQSTLVLPKIHPIFESLSAKITDSASKSNKQPLRYELVSFNMHFDQLTAKFAPVGFSIERLAETPFADNWYFSNAPVTTNEHISLLREFESATSG